MTKANSFSAENRLTNRAVESIKILVVVTSTLGTWVIGGGVLVSICAQSLVCDLYQTKTSFLSYCQSYNASLRKSKADDVIIAMMTSHENEHCRDSKTI